MLLRLILPRRVLRLDLHVAVLVYKAFEERDNSRRGVRVLFAILEDEKAQD